MTVKTAGTACKGHAEEKHSAKFRKNQGRLLKDGST